MANILKEILHGIREELAFERSKPYRATLASSETTGLNTQMRDQLEALRRGPEAGSGLSPDRVRPILPISPAKERNLKIISPEIKKDNPIISAPEPEAESLSDDDIQALLRKNQVGRGVHGLFKEGTRDLTEEDREHILELTEEKTREPGIKTESETQTPPPTQEDIELAENEKQLADFEKKSKNNVLDMKEYDKYRELIELQIKLLESKILKIKNPEQASETRLALLQQYRKYIDMSGLQIDMIVTGLKNGEIDRESAEEQFLRIKKDYESNKASVPPYEAEALKIYLERVGSELGLDQKTVVVLQEPKIENKPQDVAPSAETIETPKTWDEIFALVEKTGEVKYRGTTLSVESVRNRISRVRNEFERLKGKDRINASIVREAIANLPEEFKRQVIAVLESNPKTVPDTPLVEIKPNQDVEALGGLTQKIANAETWEDLDKAIREAGFVESDGVEYSPIDVLAPITDLRDAFKMADGNIKAPVFRHALGSVTRANGIRAKVLELLFNENDEKYFKAGDRVVFEGKKWDIVKIENGKARIQTLSEDKKAMPERVVPLTDLALEVKSVESQAPLEEDFNETSPVEALSSERRSRALGSDGFPVGFERKDATPESKAIPAGPETTAIPESIPQWKKEFQEQVNNAYQKNIGGGWRGRLADRMKGVVTFGATDYFAAERFRTGTGEIGHKMEEVANLFIEESVENNETAIKYAVDSVVGKIVKQFENKRASDGQPILTAEKLEKLQDRLIIELRAIQQSRMVSERGKFVAIIKEHLDQTWWKRYIYGFQETVAASVGLIYAMPVISSWVFGSAVVAPNALPAVKSLPTAWKLATGESPWTVSEKLLRSAGKTVNPDNIKLVDAALCRENGIGVPEWAIPGSVKHGAVAVGTTLKVANALRVIASMP